MPKSITSLLSGCGGLDLGFTGGFNFRGRNFERLDTTIVFANDFDADAQACYNNNPDKRAGKLRIQSFQPRLSKPVADKIDKLLSMHYGFTEEELDFILNYDIKYRLGYELNEE